jgi:uridylate kinase
MAHANASTPSTPTDEKNKRTVLIHRLVLTNISVDVVYRSDGGKVKRLPKIDQIVLTDVSSEGGVPMDQVMNSVLGQMLKQIFIKENLKNMLDGILQNQGNGTLEKIITPFKGLLN